MKRIVFYMLISVLIGRVVYAEDINKDIAYYYDSELFKINYQMFGGLGLSYKGESSSISFGIPKDFKDTLSSYPESKEFTKSYSKLNLVGNILLWGGLGFVLAGAYYPIFALDPNDSADAAFSDYKFGFGLMLGGFVSEIIGAFIMPASYEKLIRGVNSYNRYKIGEYKER